MPLGDTSRNTLVGLLVFDERLVWSIQVVEAPVRVSISRTCVLSNINGAAGVGRGEPSL